METSVVNTIENSFFQEVKKKYLFFLQIITSALVLIISIITIADVFTGNVKNFDKILPRICGTEISNVKSIYGYFNGTSFGDGALISRFDVEATDEALISKIDEELGFSNIPTPSEDFSTYWLNANRYYSQDGRYYTYWTYEVVDSDWNTKYYDVSSRVYGIEVFDKINWGADAH